MKILWAVFVLLLITGAAFGQSAGVLSSQPVILNFPEHPQHAAPHAMATEIPIAGAASDSYSYEHGEQPLWQFGRMSEPTPLGDVARAYRREKLAAKKAEIVVEKQGS
jgi:hypothetical protein